MVVAGASNHCHAGNCSIRIQKTTILIFTAVESLKIVSYIFLGSWPQQSTVKSQCFADLLSLSSRNTLMMMTEMEQVHKAVLIKLCNRPNEISTGIQHKNLKTYLKSYDTMI
jgi:hypothetical protein